jgi:RNA polymerase sigma-70 factor (ECF subfamily)
LIRGLLAGCLGYSPEVDDVVQQVFETALKLVTSRKVRLSGEVSGLRAWLIAIAVRLAHTEKRRRVKASKLSSPHDAERIPAPSQDAAGMELLNRTQMVVAQLPQRLSMPWILRHLERMNLEEVATTIGVSLATIKRRLAAADERFQKLAIRDSVLREYLKEGGAP